MQENIEKFKKYLTEVKLEMKNVTWPTQKDLINLTIVVITLTIILSIFIGIADKSFMELIIRILKK